VAWGGLPKTVPYSQPHMKVEGRNWGVRLGGAADKENWDEKGQGVLFRRGEGGKG